MNKREKLLLTKIVQNIQEKHNETVEAKGNETEETEAYREGRNTAYHDILDFMEFQMEVFELKTNIPGTIVPIIGERIEIQSLTLVQNLDYPASSPIYRKKVQLTSGLENFLHDFIRIIQERYNESLESEKKEIERSKAFRLGTKIGYYAILEMIDSQLKTFGFKPDELALILPNTGLIKPILGEKIVFKDLDND